MDRKDEAFVDHLLMLLNIADVKIAKLRKQLVDKQKELYETQKRITGNSGRAASCKGDN